MLGYTMGFQRNLGLRCSYAVDFPLKLKSPVALFISSMCLLPVTEIADSVGQFTCMMSNFPYRDCSDSPSTAGAQVSLLLGVHIEQDEHVPRYKNQSSVIQQLQVCPASTVIAKGVTDCIIN